MRGRLLPRALLAGLAVSVLGTIPALGAPQPVTVLVANPNAVTIDMSQLPPSAPVQVGLDSNCRNAFGNPNGKGQTYSITAVSATPGNVSVSPGTSGGLHCGDTATFTVTATCAGVGSATNVNFDPVAGAQGQQNKLAG